MKIFPSTLAASLCIVTMSNQCYAWLFIAVPTYHFPETFDRHGHFSYREGHSPRLLRGVCLAEHQQLQLMLTDSAKWHDLSFHYVAKQ
jgi:hypothetical protein